MLLRSDMLLHTNNAAMATTSLLRYLSKLPQRGVRMLLQSSDNREGFRCGHLHAIRTSAFAWAPYETVLFLHPDVYLPPRGALWLAAAMRSHPNAAFVVTRLTPRMLRNATSGRLIGSVKAHMFSTDLFVFRPAHLVPRALLGNNFTSLWHNVCVIPPSELVRWPERSLWRLIDTHGLPTTVLGMRDTSADQLHGGLWDGYGVWHAHDSAAVASVLDEGRAKAGPGADLLTWKRFWLRKPPST